MKSIPELLDHTAQLAARGCVGNGCEVNRPCLRCKQNANEIVEEALVWASRALLGASEQIVELRAGLERAELILLRARDEVRNAN